MPQYAIEGGKLHFAEALFYKFNGTIRCPHCAGAPGKQGFNKDSAGKADAAGFSRRSWCCTWSASADARRLGRKRCPRVQVTDFILLAKKSLPPIDFASVLDEVCRKYDPTEEQYSALQVYSSRVQGLSTLFEPLIQPLYSTSVLNSSFPSTGVYPVLPTASTPPPDIQPSCEVDLQLLPLISPPPTDEPDLYDTSPLHLTLTEAIPAPEATPTFLTEQLFTPYAPKRRAESEPTESPEFKRRVPTAQLYDETKLLLSKAIQHLTPLLDLGRAWKEGYERLEASFPSDDDCDLPCLASIPPSSSTIDFVQSTSPLLSKLHRPVGAVVDPNPKKPRLRKRTQQHVYGGARTVPSSIEEFIKFLPSSSS